jgi:kinetochore protein NDC80
MEVSQKTLHSPNTQFFVDICQFLVQQLDPNFVFLDWRIEIPEIFQFLGYPFRIRNQALQNVGSPHAWPTLLAALVWLVELICYRETEASQMENEDQGILSDANSNTDKIFFEYLEHAYRRFMNGADAAEIENALTQMCNEKAEIVQNEISQLSRQNENLSVSIESHVEAKKELEELQIKREEWSLDESKLESAVLKLNTHLKDLQNQIDASSSRNSIIVEECEQLSKQRHVLFNQVSSQTFSAEDFARTKRDLEHLMDNLKKLNDQESELKNNVWNYEMKIAKLVDLIERLVHEFNEKAVDLQIIPLGAKNSMGKDLQLSFSNASGPKSCLNLDLKRDIKSTLISLSSQFDEQCKLLLNQKVELAERSSKINEQIQEVAQELDSLNEKNERLEKAANEEHQRRSQELQESIKHVEDIEIEILNNEDTHAKALRQAEGVLQQLDEELEHYMMLYGSEEEEFSRQIVEIANTLLQHKLSISSQIQHYLEYLKSLQV